VTRRIASRPARLRSAAMRGDADDIEAIMVLEALRLRGQ
jgi:hypothetical protein